MARHLTRNDWIRHGLVTLGREGPNALKIGAMAARLGVSRGSFYWHFRDAADFRAQLLGAWEARTTDPVIRELAALQGEPDRLKHLLTRAFTGARGLDHAIRSWAASDPEVAKAVEAVDARRIEYIANMLIAAGVPPDRARGRAVFLCWAYLGQAMMAGARHASIGPAAIDDIGGLFER